MWHPSPSSARWRGERNATDKAYARRRGFYHEAQRSGIFQLGGCPEAGERVGGEASPDLQAEGEAGIFEVREEEDEDEKDDREGEKGDAAVHEAQPPSDVGSQDEQSAVEDKIGFFSRP
jgi:hypothetical protein